MDGQLLLVLLLLLLGASGPWGQGPGPEGPSEELLKEEFPEEEVTEEENGILVLSRRTLARALQEHPALLVEFYAPWCGPCKVLAPEYSKAAALLAAELATARLAKVDGHAEPELTEEFSVTEYPTLKFFRDGDRLHPEEYTGPREAEGIAEWLRRRVGSSATRLENEEGARALIDAQDVVVIGFFRDLQDEDAAAFLALAQDALDMTFGLTDQPELFQKFGLTKDTVVLFKKFDEGRADFPVDEELGLDQGDLSRFLLTHSMHLVTEFNSQTSPKIFAAKIPNHLLLFINQTLAPHQELLAGFGEAAPPFRGQGLGGGREGGAAGRRGAQRGLPVAGAVCGGGRGCRQRPRAAVLRCRGRGGPHPALHRHGHHQEVRACGRGAGHRSHHHGLLPCSPQRPGQALPPEPGGAPRLGPAAAQDPRRQEFRAGGF
uniref:protein disulfide-isomerase n=1 Tax=Equus caballus TaxID=9796 RepID=F6QYR2_HORSE